MGAVRMRVQTADENITIVIHMASSEAKICMFIINKFINKPFFTSNWRFLLKYESFFHNVAFSSEKVSPSESGKRYAQNKHSLHAKIVQNICGKCGFWFERTTGDAPFLWRKPYYGLWTILNRIDSFKLKSFNNGFVSYKHAAFCFAGC